MQSPRVKIGLSHRTEPLPLVSAAEGIVNIKLRHVIKELFQNPNGQQTLTRIRLSAPTQFLSLNLFSCSTRHIYEHLYIHLRDPSLCDHLAQKISSVATSMDFGRQGFLMHLNVTLTQEILIVLDVDTGFDDSDAGEGASDLIIERLKEEQSLKSNSLKDDGVHQTDGSCIICLEGFDDADALIRLPCSHVFHEPCVVRWLQTKNSCPFCRQEPYKDAEN